MIKAASGKVKDPVGMIAEAENMLAENNPGSLFVTIWLAVIDLESGHVDACNAGHDYPVVRKKGTYSIEESPHGPALAFLPGVPHIGTGFDLAARRPGAHCRLNTRVSPVTSIEMVPSVSL